jgi:hypothetical protein
MAAAADRSLLVRALSAAEARTDRQAPPKPKLKTQGNEDDNGARKRKAENVANAVSGDAGAGLVGGLDDWLVTLLLAGIHSIPALNISRV